MEITDEGGAAITVAQVRLTPAEADQLRVFIGDLIDRERSEIDFASNAHEFEVTFDARSEVILAFRQPIR